MAGAAGSRGNVAVLLAGGVGTRFGSALPKQLVTVAGRPIMAHTLAALDAHPDVDDVVLVMVASHLDEARRIVEDGGFGKVRAVLEAGDSRSATTLRALDTLGDDPDRLVVTHDAVRPFVTPRIVGDLFAALATHDAVDVAIGSRDTVVEVADGTVRRPLPREVVRRGQTPQGFRLGVLRRAYALALADPAFEPADECTVVHRYLPEVPIAVVPGDERNIKVTEPIDVHLADKLFQLASRQDRPAAQDKAALDAALGGTTTAVFGGTHGVGAAVADLAERHGSRVGRFGRSTGVRVEDADDVRRALDSLAPDGGAVDHVVIASDAAARGPLATTSEEALYAAVEVGYLGPLVVAREAVPRLRQRRRGGDLGGALLLLASPAYASGHHGASLASMADAAVVNLTQSLAEETAGEVRVTCVVRPDPAEHREVARTCLDALLWDRTGQVVDPRPTDGTG